MSNIDFEVMKNIDVMKIDRAALVDDTNIEIDINLPKTERIIDFVRKKDGNPYFRKHGKRIVKLTFPDTELTFDEIYETTLANK